MKTTAIILSALLIASVVNFAHAQSVINTYVVDSFGTMLTDPSGNILSDASCGQQVIVATNLKNPGSTTESFKVVYTIYESSTGNTVYTSSATGTIQVGATQEVSISWVAENKSELYKISEEVYDNAGNLTTSTGTMIKVSCDAQPDTKKTVDTEKHRPPVAKISEDDENKRLKDENKRLKDENKRLKDENKRLAKASINNTKSNLKSKVAIGDEGAEDDKKDKKKKVVKKAVKEMKDKVKAKKDENRLVQEGIDADGKAKAKKDEKEAGLAIGDEGAEDDKVKNKKK